MTPARPTRADLLAAHGRTLDDLLVPGLDVLFCGINPGLYSGAVGHHFARPGNRFWPALHLAGFTPRRLAAHEETQLLALGCGLTNLVHRATARADELRRDELIEGGRRLEAKLLRFRPRWLAVLGIGAFRTAFDRPQAGVGRQPESIADTPVWVLPSPSGLNAHYRLPELVEEFAKLRAVIRERANGGA